ncbi:MAG: hypothetical protein EOO09_14690 [Chitinophagaceae bacterium]|nr:MAG: hypothetical protein EOO09_14690 [Chitinophagaceae bacterium]
MYKVKILLILMTFWGHPVVAQQTDHQRLVSIKAEITGRGVPAVCAKIDTTAYYFTKASIVNLQDSSIAFFIMSCSWPMDGFAIQGDSVGVESCFRGCDHNVPEKIVLAKGQSVEFNFTIKSWKRSSAISNLRIGFRLYKTIEDIWYFEGVGKKANRYLIWSNEVKLQDKLYTYEVN